MANILAGNLDAVFMRKMSLGTHKPSIDSQRAFTFAKSDCLVQYMLGKSHWTGATVSVNGVRYRAMIRNFLANKLAENEIQHYWFQQDGAICHSARETIDLLKSMFPTRLISRNGDYDWPPPSSDLTSPDFFQGRFIPINLKPSNNLKPTYARKSVRLHPKRSQADVILKKNVIKKFL